MQPVGRTPWCSTDAVVVEQATTPMALVSCLGCEIYGRSGFAFHKFKVHTFVVEDCTRPRPTQLAGSVFEAFEDAVVVVE